MGNDADFAVKALTKLYELWAEQNGQKLMSIRFEQNEGTIDRNAPCDDFAS